ncbi:MAG: O-antigen ligase family protein [Cytobacillus gottheilii]|uniref:O-antigen ligase family protein n=1 Tax=Cytobacillus gottheilii TaxID=859144 RepID=UPI0034642D90
MKISISLTMVLVALYSIGLSNESFIIRMIENNQMLSYLFAIDSGRYLKYYNFSLLSLRKLLIIFAFSLVLIIIIKNIRRKTLRVNPIDFLNIYFFLYCFLTGLRGDFNVAAYYLFYTFLIIIMLYFVSIADYNYLFKYIVIAGVINCILIISQFIQIWKIYNYDISVIWILRPVGGLDDATLAASFVAMCLFILNIVRNQMRRYQVVLCMLLFILGGILTGSRTFIIILMFYLGFTFFRGINKNIHFKIILFSTSLSLLLLIFMKNVSSILESGFYNQIIGRLFDISDRTSILTTAFDLLGYFSIWELFFGIGSNNYDNYVYQFLQVQGSVPHNIFISMLVDHGLFGLTFYITFIIINYILLRKNLAKSNAATNIKIIYIIFVISSFTENLNYSYAHMAVLILITAVAKVAGKKENTRILKT